MMLSTAVKKTIASPSIKSIATRCMSTVVVPPVPPHATPVPPTPTLHHSAQPAQTTAVSFRTDMPEIEFVNVPTKVCPSYDIRESPLDYEMTLFLPSNVNAESVTVDFEPGNKAMRIHADEADANGNYFSKRFAWGGVLDISRLQSDFTNGKLRIQAPKIHYLNGNSPLNASVQFA